MPRSSFFIHHHNHYPIQNLDSIGEDPPINTRSKNMFSDLPSLDRSTNTEEENDKNMKF